MGGGGNLFWVVVVKSVSGNCEKCWENRWHQYVGPSTTSAAPRPKARWAGHANEDKTQYPGNSGNEKSKEKNSHPSLHFHELSTE